MSRLSAGCHRADSRRLLTEKQPVRCLIDVAASPVQCLFKSQLRSLSPGCGSSQRLRILRLMFILAPLKERTYS